MDPKMKQAVLDAASKRAGVLINGGRQIASEMFQSIIQGVSKQQEAGEKLFMLRMAAIHILAMESFNYEKGTGVKGNIAIDQMVLDIRNELKWLQIEEMAGRLKKTDITKQSEQGEAAPEPEPKPETTL